MASVVISGDTSGSVTLSAPAVSGSSVLTLPAVTGTVVTTGSTAVVSQAMLAAGVAGTGPAFSAYAGSNQTMSNATWTKILFGTEEFDTNNNFASSRFTPTVAGYYQVTGSCNFAASAVNTRFVAIYKNGSIYKNLQNLPSNATNYMLLSGSILVYLNGSTDYVEVYAQQNSGGSLDTSGSETQVYFQGAMVRAA